MTCELRPLSAEDCEHARAWRNEALHTLRTPYQLGAAQQEAFYRDVVCARDSRHRYFGIHWDSEHSVGRMSPEEVRAEAGTGRLTLPRIQSINGKPATEALVGMGGLTNIEWENGLAEISLIVAPDSRGKHVGSEAVRLLLAQAFDRMRLDTVFGECYSLNKEGVAFWQRIVEHYHGETARLPRRKFWDGELWDSLYFSIARENYKTVTGGTDGRSEDALPPAQ